MFENEAFLSCRFALWKEEILITQLYKVAFQHTMSEIISLGLFPLPLISSLASNAGPIISRWKQRGSTKEREVNYRFCWPWVNVQCERLRRMQFNQFEDLWSKGRQKRQMRPGRLEMIKNVGVHSMLNIEICGVCEDWEIEIYNYINNNNYYNDDYNSTY